MTADTDRDSVEAMVARLKDHRFYNWAEAMELAAAMLTALLAERDAAHRAGRVEMREEAAAVAANCILCENIATAIRAATREKTNG